VSSWAIKVRCKWKSELRPYTSRRSDREGMIFSASFVDAEGTDISAALFDDVATRYHPVLEAGCVYYIGMVPPTSSPPSIIATP
jgi:hypothetical protein